MESTARVEPSSTARSQAELEEGVGDSEQVMDRAEKRRRDVPCMSPGEEDLIHRLHRLLGERWSLISDRLPGRSAEEVERYWMEVERKRYRETKLFKPRCRRLMRSPSFPPLLNSSTADNNSTALDVSPSDHLPVLEHREDETTFSHSYS